MEDPPLISVVIPVFNGVRYLGEAIDSVLAQAYRPIEVIVVDDDSTDGSSALAEAWSDAVRVYRQVHGGIGSARNLGVRRARGAFLAFLDADDLWAEGKLERQMAAFDRDPGLDLVFGAVRQFISPELEQALGGRIRCPAGDAPGVHPGAMLVRSGSFLRVGWFRTDCRVGEFIDWYGRAVDAGLRIEVLAERVLLRRLHAANQGIREKESTGDYLRVLRSALDRRRAGPSETDAGTRSR